MVRKVAETFDEACAAAGEAPRRCDLVASRAIYVADTDEQAWAHVERDFDEVISHSRKHAEPATAVLADNARKQGPVATFRTMLEAGNIIAGSPATVTDAIQRLYDDVGGFGTMLLVAGRDFATAEQRDNSYRLFAEAVAPKLAAHGEREAQKAPGRIALAA